MTTPPRKPGGDPDATNQRLLPESSSDEQLVGETRVDPPLVGEARRALPDEGGREGPPLFDSPDVVGTRALPDVGVVAELRAALSNPPPNARTMLPLYAAPDTIVVGRGTACDWQLDDDSLSRKHCEFHWSGATAQLTVEDLGAANGTRVNGRPVRQPTTVQPGDTVQIGTVVIALAMRSSARAQSPDEQSTRIVPELDPLATRVGTPPDAQATRVTLPPEAPPGLSPLNAVPTVVRPQPTPPQPDLEITKRGSQVFRPERDFAAPEEKTRAWDARAVLVRAPERAFDGEVSEWLRQNRRMLVLAGAAAWLAILLIVWSAFEPQPADEQPVAPPHARTVPAPAPPTSPTAPPTPATAPPTPATAPPTPATAPGAGEQVVEAAGAPDDLERAIAAYDQGRLPEALTLWKRLAQSGDPTAAFMVELIAARLGAAP